MTEYKVGDRGVTRDGRVVECFGLTGGVIYPLKWKYVGGIDDDWWTTTSSGLEYTTHMTDCDIIRIADDAKVEPEPAADEAANDEPPSTLRTRASFSSDEYVIGGVHLIATCSGGKVSLHIDDKELSESEAAAVMRTIETVMEQARRAKGVVG